MSTFYIAKQGHQQGPFSISEVETKLTSGKLLWNDYIYDSKTEDWVLLMEFSLLTELFNQSFANPINLVPNQQINQSNVNSDPLKQRIWYVLKQNNNYGPFAKIELIQMLQGKTLHEFDFVWNQGLAAWKRLSEVSDFATEEIQSLFKSLNRENDETGNAIFFRRKYERVKCESSAIVHDHKKVYKATGVEISLGGAGLTIEGVKLKMDQIVYLHFKPGQNVPTFNAICKVVSQKGQIFGVQFLKISGAAKSALTEFTLANKKQKVS
jgi:hypothetical protein